MPGEQRWTYHYDDGAQGEVIRAADTDRFIPILVAPGGGAGRVFADAPSLALAVSTVDAEAQRQSDVADWIADPAPGVEAYSVEARSMPRPRLEATDGIVATSGEYSGDATSAMPLEGDARLCPYPGCNGTQTFAKAGRPPGAATEGGVAGTQDRVAGDQEAQAGWFCDVKADHVDPVEAH